MAESNTASVECPLCDEAFDPTAAGGWCTNSDCGEWQYEADATPEQQTESERNEDAVDEASTTDDAAVGSDGDEAGEETESPWATSGSAGGTPDEEVSDEATPDEETPHEATTGEPALDDEGDVGEETVAADLDGDAGSTGGDADPDDAPAGADGDDAEPDSVGADADSADEPNGDGGEPDPGSAGREAGSEVSDDEGEETFDCPGCGSTLDAEVNFCPDCGEDVSDYPADDEDDGDELDVCPSCGADVDPEDSFCASCGEDLDAHRGADELTECPDCGADVDADDSFCAGCGADLDAYRGDAAGQAATGPAEGGDSSAPDELALRAHGRSVVVEDGDAVGREIRSLLTDAGRPEDEAVRVHREHVRFVRESGQFYVVALGANPTSVNGVSMAKGDREPIGPGDELSLSDVVTLTVETA